MDNADFSEAISSLHSTIYRVAYSYTRNYADAEEITQEAFFKLYLCEKEIPAPEAHKIDSDDLREIVVKLTPEQMIAVYLHYYEGYYLKEIGKMCGTTAASV